MASKSSVSFNVDHKWPRLTTQRVMWSFSETWWFTTIVYFYTMTKFAYTKRDFCLAAYGGVVLQWFEFIKACMGKNGNWHYSWNFDIFTIKMTCLSALLSFYCLLASQVNQKRPLKPLSFFGFPLPKSKGKCAAFPWAFALKLKKKNKNNSLHCEPGPPVCGLHFKSMTRIIVIWVSHIIWVL